MRPSTALPVTILLLMLVSTTLAIRTSNGEGCIFENSTGFQFISHHGDVNVEAGSDTFVDCVLNENSTFTSKNLKWSGGITEIINDKTLRLYVNNASMDTLNMKRKCVNMVNNKGICLVAIKPGMKPKEVENFSCTAFNMEYLDCTWRVPKNIYTNYSLVAILRGNQRSFPCKSSQRGISKQLYGCNFTAMGPLQYYVYNTNYTLEMTGKNVFGNASWIYSFNHHSRVLPKEVIQLSASEIGSRTMKISWKPSLGMQANYAPKLRYRVHYTSQWGKESGWQIVPETFTEITDLQPFTSYRIVVSSSSINATDEALWSPVAVINVTTEQDVPDVPPEVTNGSFFVVSDFNSRNVTLYWKSVEEYQKNGAPFTYHATARSLELVDENALIIDGVEVDEGSGRNLESEDENALIIDGVEVDEGSAQFINLSVRKSYLFTIYSENSKGRSKRTSKVILRGTSEMLDKPDSLTVIAITPTQYNVSWMPPAKPDGIVGYTLFYTSTDKLFHKNYNGYLSWVTADVNTRSVSITMPNTYPYHYFAVATYGDKSSSDMLWNTCIVSYNGTVSKLKKIWVGQKYATNVTIRWSIDCAEKLGIIRGYNVYYCIVDSQYSEVCTRQQHTHHVPGANTDNAVIVNLLPFTHYKFAVSVETIKADSELSNALLVRTDEGVPSSAAVDVQIPEHTNSSFVLKWHPPSTPNGYITRYEITYESGIGRRQSLPYQVHSFNETTHVLNVTDDIHHEVAPYTNYTVKLRACTHKGCSITSDPVTVQTDIGVPGQMEPPQARLVNLSHALVQPEMRDSLNGPELNWELKIEVIDGTNETLYEWFQGNLTETMLYVPFDCEHPDFKEAVAQLRTRAFNEKDGSHLYGPWSDYTKLPCIMSTYPVSTILAIVAGATVALIFVVIMAMCVSKRVKIFIEKYNIKVVLPDGLEGAVNYNAFNAGMKQHRYMDHSYSKGELICGSSPNSRLLKSESRTRNISNETSRSTTSSELLLLQDQRGRSNWADESMTSANNDSISSRPSTTQTHLSSDSSIELTPSVPESPDSVFGEHPLKNPLVGQIVQASQASSNFNPTLTPIGESQDGGGSSHNSTPQHYSRFASYYDPKDRQGSSSSLTPVSSADGAATSSYVAAPYSQFGVANENWPTASVPSSQPNSLRLQGDNIPVASYLPSYSKLGMNIPTFDEPPHILKHGATNGGPLTSTPTRSTAGYSVLGMGDQPYDEQPPPPLPGSAAKGYVMAAMLNDVNPMFEQCSGASELPSSAGETVVSPTVTPSTSKQDDVGALPTTADYINMDSHKRSPSNASSLTAGYCRFGLSRPTSVSSESSHCVPAEPTLCPSPSKAGSCRTSIEVNASSPYHDIQCSDGAPTAAADEQQVPTCSTVVHADLHAPSGYATVQQLLKSEGNS